jgi:RND family efflux transporter MFP subunit
MSAAMNGARHWVVSTAAAVLMELLASCGGRSVAAKSPSSAGCSEVGVVKVVRKSLHRTLVIPSELVPYQQIDIYAKESGFVQQLNVDYGSHVKVGQVMAVLEIPELQAQLDEDEAAIQSASQEIGRRQDDLNRVQAQQKATHLEFTRLDQVAARQPGLVAQQEIDDWQAKDAAAQAQVSAVRAVLESAQSELVRAQARRHHDQVLFDYSRITAPFAGVVTKRYANLGTLMQAGTNSSTQALPLVQLSQDDRFRLVIPVPEAYVPLIRIGDGVDVRVPSLNRSFPGTVSRFSVDVEADTRTMHTEVDVMNPNRVLMPGMYAEATLALNRRDRVIAVPPEAVITDGDKSTVWVVGPSNKVEARNVMLGVETPAEVEVTSGLNEGNLVVVGDRSGLTTGETVCPKEVHLLQYHGE